MGISVAGLKPSTLSWISVGTPLSLSSTLGLVPAEAVGALSLLPSPSALSKCRACWTVLGALAAWPHCLPAPSPCFAAFSCASGSMPRALAMEGQPCQALCVLMRDTVPTVHTPCQAQSVPPDGLGAQGCQQAVCSALCPKGIARSLTACFMSGRSTPGACTPSGLCRPTWAL